MAYVSAMSPCRQCGRVFSYNPNLVPSLFFLADKQVPAGTPGATKEPFCLPCITAANPKRIANGLQPIVPAPGAYEPCDESELAYGD
jgi:hypothetical protein